jgi:aryl-alcohol dehydrogenase-like predicted oxidoreductase
VLLRGVMTHRFALLPEQLAELRSVIAQLSHLADAEGCSLPEMAYRFVLAHPAVTTALVGTARIAELQAALACAGKEPLPPALVAAIRQIRISDLNQLNPGTWPADMGEWQGQTK